MKHHKRTLALIGGQGINNTEADEMSLAFILEKYDVGLSLLKKNNAGIFRMLRTSLLSNGTYQQINCL